MTNIVLCGGSGTRLWPLSRTLMPKQFLRIFDNKSLFELTYERNAKLCDKTLIISNQEQYFLILDQINTHKAEYILESIPKNTAAAITISAFSLPKDEIVLVSPSDHLIKNEKAYESAVCQALEFAKNDFIVTFGIKPSYTETGYGYIHCEGNEVLGFYEKPNKEKAEYFIKEGAYLWNSGMFMFKTSFFLTQMKEFASEIYDKCLKAYQNAIKIDSLIKIRNEDMQDMPSISIDNALMEKTKKIKIIKTDMGWSDVGSFSTLSKELQNENDNFINSRHKFIDCKNNFFYCQNNKKFIAAIDVENMVVVDTDDALLISKKDSTQKVKDIVLSIKDDKNLSINHLTSHRPWGTYTILESDKGYKIKRIEVKPNKRLSLQKHFHRNEHWIVLSGTATIEIEGEKSLVRPNESIYIKMGQKHRLSNNGKIPVVLIEVQVGEYTEEDDIVRFDDDFGRDDKTKG